MSRRLYKGDVAWILPGKKKPFAYSTVSTNDLIIAVAQKYDTVQQVYDAIEFDYEAKAKAILQKFIDAGFGNLVLRTVVF